MWSQSRQSTIAKGMKGLSILREGLLEIDIKLSNFTHGKDHTHNYHIFPEGTIFQMGEDGTLPPGWQWAVNNVWKHFWFSQLVEGYFWHLVTYGARNGAKHPTVHRESPKQRLVKPKMSVVLRPINCLGGTEQQVRWSLTGWIGTGIPQTLLQQDYGGEDWIGWSDNPRVSIVEKIIVYVTY